MTDDLDTLQARPTDPVLDAPDLSAAAAPRPVSVPSHRADVAPEAVVRNEVDEPRPASVARHSTDTSAITLPVLPVAVDPSLPQPPERLTLDDGDLVRLVERRFTDTAMIDLLAVVQAQLDARQVEAERFAAWESTISRIDGDEAAEVLERTRLRFTGVIPVQRPADAQEAPVATAKPVAPAAPRPVDVAALVASSPVTAPVAGPADDATGGASATTEPVGDEGAAPVEDLPGTDAATGAEPSSGPVDVAAVPAPAEAEAVASRAPRAALLTRPLVLGALGAAALVVLAAVVLVLAAPTSLAAGLLATLAVPAVAGLAAVGALVSLAAGPADVARIRSRGPLAVVAGLVLATVLGLGVLVPAVRGLAWQGFLLRASGVEGLSVGVGLVAAVLVAAAVAFIVTVLVTGFRSAPAADRA